MFRRTTTGLMVLLVSSICLWSDGRENPAVTNLRLALDQLDFLDLSGNWLVVPVRERYQGADLNGDGDMGDYVLHVRDLEAAETTNLGLVAVDCEFACHMAGLLYGRWLGLAVAENLLGEDLNGDGDTEDRVLHLRDLEAAETTNLGLSGNLGLGGHGAILSEKWFVFTVFEEGQGEDLNGDGDGDDTVFFAHNLARRETINLRIARSPPSFPRLFGDWLVLGISERGLDEDLNGDGDTADDWVLHVRDLEAAETTNLGLTGDSAMISGKWLVFGTWERRQGEDLNGDGDTEDKVIHVHDLESGKTTNLRLAISDGWTGYALSGNWVVFGAPEQNQGEDLNGDGNILDPVIHVHDLEAGETKNLGLTGLGIGAVFSGEWLVFHVDRVFHVHDLETGETTNLGIAGYGLQLAGKWLVARVRESLQGEDVNGDGDTEDDVLHVHDLEIGETTNLGIAGYGLLSSKWLVFFADEDAQGEDLNGDGDTEDRVLHLRDLEAAETTNLGLTAVSAILSDDRLAFNVNEGRQGQDLNGDGDMGDYVLHVRDLEAAETTNLGLATAIPIDRVSGKWLVFRVSEDNQADDLNGDGDTSDLVVHVADLEALYRLPRFIRGDCNDDGEVDISDAIFSLGSLFLGDGDPNCDDACDSNDDGLLDVSDPVATLSHLFLGDPTVIAAPGTKECGADRTEDELACETFAGCVTE